MRQDALIEGEHAEFAVEQGESHGLGGDMVGRMVGKKMDEYDLNAAALANMALLIVSIECDARMTRTPHRQWPACLNQIYADFCQTNQNGLQNLSSASRFATFQLF
ncbi:MAG: hypothetical protein NVS3B11_17100 [Collimonas sp.]